MYYLYESQKKVYSSSHPWLVYSLDAIKIFQIDGLVQERRNSSALAM